MLNKNMVFITITVIAVTIIVTATTYFSRRKKEKESTAGKAGDDVEQSNLTHAESWYSQTAESLYEKMAGWGTSDEDGFLVLIKQIKNIDDWNMLVFSFGKFDKESLTAWITGDFSGFYLKEIRNHLNSVGVFSI